MEWIRLNGRIEEAQEMADTAVDILVESIIDWRVDNV